MIYSNYNKEDYIENEKEDDVKCIEASVKWYSPEKGYGFLFYNGESLQEIKIHFSKLDTIKCAYLKPGDRVICEISLGKFGLQVERVIDVKLSSPEKRTLTGFRNSRFSSFNTESLEEVEGVIKWYNIEKGYGFITPFDKGREIFLHHSVLKATGFHYLEPGVHVRAKVFASERGLEARELIIFRNEKNT